MATTAQQIVDDARRIANDGSTRFTDAMGLAAVNMGLRELCIVLPSAYTVRTVATLASGARQSVAALSPTGTQVVDVTANYTGPSTAGSAITQLEGGRRWLDEMRPSWQTETPTATVKHWFSDDRDPAAFYVWPPSNGGRAEVIYRATPALLGALSSNIPVDDLYSAPLAYLTLWSFFSTNKPGTVSAQLAANYRTTAMQLLGVKVQNDVRTDRNEREA